MQKILTGRNLWLAVGLVVAALSAHAGWIDPNMVDPNMAIAFGAIGATQMSNSQARVIDPILSEVAQGYRNADMVGLNLFPYVPVTSRGGKIIAFGKEDFALYNTQRAPGANTKRIQFGYAAGNYTLEQHALEAVAPWELQQEASVVAQVNLANMAVRKVQNIIALRLEKAQADIATTAASYAATNKITLSGASQWSDYSGTSNPSKDIETGKEAIRSQIGRRGNTVVLSAQAFKAAKQHPSIIDRIKYTGRDVITAEMLAALWDVDRVVVGDAVYADASGTLTDVWGKFVVVAYTNLSGVADFGEPTYGYTYRLDGAPFVEEGYADKNAKSDIYPVTDEVAPVLTAALSGYLISNAVA
ncbi:hypothetical protein [Dechloromonas sp. CZR5]|uniref:major capsid protein n=1 Tax=Dechloromonas sp. CZR5 TaxID=2608630 RepID=UPI001CC34132|nr:hypothetical protein [Dechloromonas sp. CZR5]